MVATKGLEDSAGSPRKMPEYVDLKEIVDLIMILLISIKEIIDLIMLNIKETDKEHWGKKKDSLVLLHLNYLLLENYIITCPNSYLRQLIKELSSFM